VVSATCGEARFTDLRIDRAGAYYLRFNTEFVASFSAMAPQPRDTTSQIFSIVPGLPTTLSVVRRAKGMRSGRVFLVQPVIEVVDVGKNRVVGDAPAVTAICFPRPTCEIGQPIAFEQTQVLARTDAVISTPQAGIVTYQGDESIGIVSSIKGASLRYTASGATSTDMPISCGRTPYRLNIVQDAPTVAQSGEPFQVSVQLVAKLDQPFGWYQTSPAAVSVELYRRRFNYNTLAPLRGTLQAAANLDGLITFTDLEVEEISGDLLQVAVG